MLWAGLKPSAELADLAEEVRRVLTAAGIPFDRRAFCPHITLARKPQLPEGIRLSDITVPETEMTVDHLCLYWSHRDESGLQYTVIGRTGTDPAQ